MGSVFAEMGNYDRQALIPHEQDQTNSARMATSCVSDLLQNSPDAIQRRLSLEKRQSVDPYGDSSARIKYDFAPYRLRVA